jgi:hypothetical protein
VRRPAFHARNAAMLSHSLATTRQAGSSGARSSSLRSRPGVPASCRLIAWYAATTSPAVAASPRCHTSTRTRWLIGGPFRRRACARSPA